MDANTFLIINKLQKGEQIEFRDYILYLVALPIVSFFLAKLIPAYTWIYECVIFRVKSYYSKKELKLEGFEVINCNHINYNYPLPLTAMNWYINMNYRHLCIDRKIYDKQWLNWTNGNGSPLNSEEFEYTMDSTRTKWIALNPDISFQIYRSNVDTKFDNNMQEYYSFSKTMVCLTLASRTIDMRAFIEQVTKSYLKFQAEQNRDKLFHFVYQGISKDEKLEFTKNLFSDLVEEPNNETFDHLFCEHNHSLIKDLDRLHDLEYYKRTGFSRKKGYLFFGEPGCGKTRTVLAMANYDKRHIIEISPIKLKTNKEFSQILNLSEINGVKFKPSEVIYLIEEIDTSKVTKNRDEQPKPAVEDKKEITVVLSDKEETKEMRELVEHV